MYFGAKVLILDEPTAARKSSSQAWCCATSCRLATAGLGVIFITHNPHHAYPVGDSFLLLKRGRSIGYYTKSEITVEELTAQMAGGAGWLNWPMNSNSSAGMPRNWPKPKPVPARRQRHSRTNNKAWASSPS